MKNASEELGVVKRRMMKYAHQVAGGVNRNLEFSTFSSV
jgi:hypothetical protein